MSSHFVTTPVVGKTCPRCHCLILAGWAEGLAANVDLAPLTPAGELHALLARRRTYTLTRSGLVERDASRIAGGHLRGPILTAHRCGQPVPDADRVPAAPPQPTDQLSY